MSTVMGVLDWQDAVIASDGCAGNPCHSKYVLKTARIGPKLSIGMTGDSGFMPEILSSLGIEIPDTVASEEIFWHIEEAIGPVETDFPSAYGVLAKTLLDMRLRLRYSEHKVAVVIVGGHEGAVLHGQWDGDNDWEPEQLYQANVGTAASFNMGRGAESEDEQAALVARVDFSRGAGGAERRLVEAVRYWSDCDKCRTVNRNVFTRRLSDDFTLRYALEPDVQHCDRIQKRLAAVNAIPIPNR
jgi:hypothetical protein